MPVIIKPQIRKTSELLYHNDLGPGLRYVFLDNSLYSKSEFYAIGRRVERIPKNQQDYIEEHRHNCNSFYFFIGDNENLTGLKAKISIEGKEFFAESPSTVMIPKHGLHHYKLTSGKGWFFHVIPKPNYNESIVKGKFSKPESFNISEVYHKFEKQTETPKSTERPIISGNGKLKNPQRWILVDPKMFAKAGIYAALHQIFNDSPFKLNQKLHYHYTDEFYLFFSQGKEPLKVNMYGSEKEKKKITSPATVYHLKGTKHKYDYVSGRGFVLVVLKEKIPREGYKFSIE